MPKLPPTRPPYAQSCCRKGAVKDTANTSVDIFAKHVNRRQGAFFLPASNIERMQRAAEAREHRGDVGGESFHRPSTAGHSLEGYRKAILLGVGGGISLMRVIVGYGLDTPIQAMRLITWTGGKKEPVGWLVR